MFKGKLYPFQQEAVDVMVERGQMLLALVMGAGKTVTTLAALEYLYENKEIERALIVVPAALKYQWLREVQKFTDAHATVIDGSQNTRVDLWRKSIGSRYVIVNPESLKRDFSYYSEQAFGAMVIDEATMIKTPRSQRSRMLKRIGKTYHYRFALTGQPIENRPEELFSIMEFVNSKILGDFNTFDRTFIVRDRMFGRPLRYRNLDVLQNSLRPVMIRKRREDIADQLPKIVHSVIPVPFDKDGARAYRIIARELLDSIQKAISTFGRGFDLWTHYYGRQDNSDQGFIMSQITALRMFCDNPQLVLLSAHLHNTTTKQGSEYANKLVKRGIVYSKLKSPKQETLVEYLETVLNEDPKNKVVLFSFYTYNLKLIQKATAHLTRSVIFDGTMNNAQRDVAKQTFTNDPSVRLFLSSDAGGYGLDLPVANYLISYDLPWSAGKLDQRESRIIRLSSEHTHVNIVALVMEGSVEERQYEMLQEKRNINKAFIDGEYDYSNSYQITLGTLSDFLKTSEV
jgi:SNF2 family DNA or RNA helicase